MNNQAPIREPYQVSGNLARTTSAWDNWFQQVFDGLRAWSRSLGATVTLDFPSISAQSQQALTVTVTGARTGDWVSVAPAADVSGVIFTGSVTAKDTVTVYAKNFTAGAIDPASQAFRITVIQG